MNIRVSLAFGVTSLFALGAAGSLVGMAGGCGSSAGSYCASRCDCQGCSQLEREDCVDDVEDADKLAAHDGCASAYGDYLDCYVGEGTCASGSWVAASCARKASELRECSARAAKFVKSACEDEKLKFESCGLTGGGSNPCTPDSECVAFCSLAASCDDLSAPQPGTVYVDCVLACSGGSSSSSSSSSVGSSGGSSGGSGSGG